MSIKRLFNILILTCVFTGVAQAEVKKINEDLYFKDLDGCFLLYNLQKNKFDIQIGGEKCNLQLPACSTFKVPLAVIAFDAGLLKDENVILKWDGVKSLREETNKDHNAKTWMRDSVVWFSQRLTKKMGLENLQNYINKFNYGNRDLRAGIDNAWLVSPGDSGPALKISAFEQIDFLKNLWAEKLLASAKAMQKTKEIIYLETSPAGYKFSGKTGSNFYDKDKKRHLGWFVGHIQKDSSSYLVVTNLSDRAPLESKKYGGLRAKELTKKILADNQLW